jgi:hypothetical protein
MAGSFSVIQPLDDVAGSDDELDSVQGDVTEFAEKEDNLEEFDEEDFDDDFDDDFEEDLDEDDDYGGAGDDDLEDEGFESD